MKLDMSWVFPCRRPLCVACDDMLLEAWERQTTGGLKVPCLPGYPYAHAIETPLRYLSRAGDLLWC